MSHNVTFTIPEKDLGRADVEFKIKIDKTVFATLKVSKGSLVWVPRDKTYGYHINWCSFDEFMQQKGTPE